MTMKCVIGLGNPGRKYKDTRHNAGYMVIDKIAESCGLVRRRAGLFEVALRQDAFEPGGFFLLWPLTFMNASGRAVREFMRERSIALGDMLVVHDDLDLPLGKIRIKQKGSAGGHRGVESIIENLGTWDFPRLKIGIGRPGIGVDPAEYVLSPFDAPELHTKDVAVALAVDAILFLHSQGIEAAMGRFNGPPPPGEGGV